MIKKTFLKSILLLLCMIVGGASSAWADETYSFTPDQSSTGSDATTYITTLTEFTYNKISWKMNQWNPKTLQVKTNQGSAASEFRFYNTSAFPERIKQVVITFSALTVSDASKLMFLGGTSEVTATTGGTAGTWNSTTKTLTWTPGSSDNYTYFAFYQNGKAASGTNYLASSDAIVVTYESAASATALAVKTAPTKVNYKKGETLDLTDLVLDATVGGNHVDVTSGYTADPADGATLNEVGAKTITFTYGGQTTKQTIHVGDLESIALTTTGVKTTYDEGQTFDPENLVVTATFSDGETTPTTWTEDVTASCTFEPDGALETTDDNVTVSYTLSYPLGSTTKTADIDITVNAASAYTVTFNAGTGSCETASLTEASAKAGVTLPEATTGITGWSFAGWATASVTNTEDEPTLYAVGDIYKPTDNCILYAVYELSEVSTTIYKRATSVSDITSADKIVIAYNDGKVLNTSINISTTLEETNGKVTPASNAIFTLSGDNTDGYTLTNGTNTIGATGTGNSLTIALSSTNNLWTFSASTYGSNHFNVNNKGASGKSLEIYNSAWKAYALSASEQAWAMRIYVPAEITFYNSNPAAIVNPIVAWTTDGDKTLYLKNTNTYTNAANVTGIAKTPVYTSSDATVATVSEAGLVTALKVGTTTIKATVAAEVGVNSKAEASYTVTVKDASDIAGLKAITSTSTVNTFTADLTDAVVTYVKGNHAFIQDASGAVYASCGSSLTAGNKINGAVTGSIKAANAIDEITAITLTAATVTEDGVIPSAEVKTAAQLVAKKADLEGKLVQITGATITASLTSGSASGGKISDDGKTNEINLYAPDSNIEALKDAEGTFNGYITLYGGSTIRFNIFEQSQITLTKNAPTDQPLTFESNAVELDEETSEFTAFKGQAVSGAKGTVTYSIKDGDDESGVVSSINSSTGAIVLSGSKGTATITVTAAEEEETVAGVTTPWKETTKTYSITVYPRYTSTFNINGDETVLRQATHGASIVVPTPAASIGDYSFIGWSTSTVATTNDAPETVTPPTTPESTVTYYAVYALERESGEEKVTSTLNLQQSEPADSKSTVNGVAWSWSKLTFATSTNNVGMKGGDNATVTIKLPNNAIKAVKLSLVRSQSWGDATVVISNSSGELGSIGKTGNAYYEFTSSNNTSGTYSLSQSTSKNAWISSFTMEFTVPGIENYGYCTTLPVVSVTIPASTYAARCFNRPLDYSSAGITVYTAKLNTTTHAVTLTEVASGKVPANEGVIIHADAGTYAVPVAASADALSNNEMVGVTARTQVQYTTGDTYYNYILQTENGDPVFNMATGAYLPAGRAYLHTQYDASGAGARLAVVFEDGQTTTIQGVSVRNIAPDTYYNLKGQRVENPKKGELYIVGGKKVIFK